MRRLVLLCLGVVSCASPDVPRLDGVPEDPGGVPPLPVSPTHPAAVPSGQATTSDDGARSQDQVLDAGVTTAPTTTATTTSGFNTTTPATTSGETMGHSAALTDGSETEVDTQEGVPGGADAGVAPSDGGDVSSSDSQSIESTGDAGDSTHNDAGAVDAR